MRGRSPGKTGPRYHGFTPVRGGAIIMDFFLVGSTGQHAAHARRRPHRRQRRPHTRRPILTRAREKLSIIVYRDVTTLRPALGLLRQPTCEGTGRARRSSARRPRAPPAARCGRRRTARRPLVRVRVRVRIRLRLWLRVRVRVRVRARARVSLRARWPESRRYATARGWVSPFRQL